MNEVLVKYKIRESCTVDTVDVIYPKFQLRSREADNLANGGIQQLTYIDEPSLYRLIPHSKLPEAEIFDVKLKSGSKVQKSNTAFYITEKGYYERLRQVSGIVLN